MQPSQSIKIEDAGLLLMSACHNLACKAGWWTDLNTGEDLRGKKSIPELLMLIVSELGEAMEGHRKNLPDAHVPDRSSLEVELADAVIRIFDLAGGMSIDLPEQSWTSFVTTNIAPTIVPRIGAKTAERCTDA